MTKQLEIKFIRKSKNDSLLNIAYKNFIEYLIQYSSPYNQFWLDNYLHEVIGFLRALEFSNKITEEESNRLYKIASDIRFLVLEEKTCEKLK